MSESYANKDHAPHTTPNDGGYNFEFRQLVDPELREEYTQLTGELIYKMTHGLTVIDAQKGQATIEIPSVVVWLDKEARPLSWLTSNMWNSLAFDKTGNAAKKPEFKYMGMNYVQWINCLSDDGDGSINIDQVDPTVFRSLRAAFTISPNKDQGLTTDIDTEPAYLDNKIIMVVSESQSNTLAMQYSQQFIRKAFPTSKVGGAYWMDEHQTPVWARRDEVGGRGISTANDKFTRSSITTRQRLGRYFLGTILEGGFSNDPLSVELRKELKQLPV